MKDRVYEEQQCFLHLFSFVPFYIFPRKLDWMKWNSERSNENKKKKTKKFKFWCIKIRYPTNDSRFHVCFQPTTMDLRSFAIIFCALCNKRTKNNIWDCISVSIRFFWHCLCIIHAEHSFYVHRIVTHSAFLSLTVFTVFSWSPLCSFRNVFAWPIVNKVM